MAKRLRKKVRVDRSSYRNFSKKLFNLFLLIVLLFLAVKNNPFAVFFTSQEQVETPSAFIEVVGKYAQEDYPRTGLLPSVVVAQAILESDYGRSQLATEAKNLFGQKAGTYQKKARYLTSEYTQNGWEEIQDDFAVFPNWKDSVIAHGNLILNGIDGNPDRYQKVKEAKTYQQASYALQEAGYATDPNYAQKLISVIQKENLIRFDP